MNLSVQDYKAIGVKDVTKFLPFLNKYMEYALINTIPRINAFLATLLHESGNFYYVKEIADGSAYEDRKDLGNIVIGDGKRFKGRGLIQMTGRSNYRAFTLWIKNKFGININFELEPEKVEQPEYAVLVSIWYWEVNKLNNYADKNDFDNIQSIVNTGKPNRVEKVIHLKERRAKYDTVKKWSSKLILSTLNNI